jgi:hypothetical protein
MKRYMTRIALLAITFMMVQPVRADEGMWLPLLMNEARYDAMRARGFRLTAEDLYSVNQASLKDAIVLFGRGCTGELVSAEGLMLTNHHCGYSRIQAHSSVERDYLTHGFWAANKGEELPNEGLTASILVRMEDVTSRVNNLLKATMTEKERADAIKTVSAEIVAEATKGTHYAAEVKPFYHGNQFILMVMEVFRDIRLVGAPPSGIGKFGGDTDNWVWPRHTGDFAIFRIYAGKDNKPAVYSKENTPYVPRKFFEISLKGAEEGDFTMVYGFPAQTEQYLPSPAIALYQHHKYPIIIDVRDHELAIINHTMAQTDALRIMYAARQASVANGWKKFIGVLPGLERFRVYEKKQEGEQQLRLQLSDDPAKLAMYDGILKGYEDAYAALEPVEIWNTYFTECFWKQPLFRFVFRGYWMAPITPATPAGADAFQKTVAEINQALPGFYTSVNMATEKALFAEMVRLFMTGVPEAQIPQQLSKALKSAKGDYTLLAEQVIQRSIFRDEQTAANFFGQWNNDKSIKKLRKDPLFALMKEIVDAYRNTCHPSLLAINQTIDSLHRLNMQILLEQNEPGTLFPDANSTLRISYGQVGGSFPRDGVRYHHQTTLDGIIMKGEMNIEDYAVPPRLAELADPIHYGPYGINNTMPVAFIASNHTTGGNSGSPILNADGHLIGINFDRAWEGTMSDLNFEPSICRNISIDIRYLLFVVDKYAGAKHLINEMVIHW